MQVRDHPIYHLIKARIHRRAGNVEGAAQQLHGAIELPLFTGELVCFLAMINLMSGKESAEKKGPLKLALTQTDRVVIYLELIDALQTLGKSVSNAAHSSNTIEMRRLKPPS